YGFSSLTLEHPVLHVIVHPDGSTNQPSPPVQRSNDRAAIEQLFSLSIGRLIVSSGELLWNDQRVPLDFAVNDLAVQMNYSLFHRRYESLLHIGKVDAKIFDYRPFASTLQAQFLLSSNHVEIPSLLWNSGRSHLEASGRIDNLSDPRLIINYSGKVEFAELASIMRLREVQGGTLDLSGQGSYAAHNFLSKGTALVRDLDYHDNTVQLRHAAVSANYSAGNSRLRLSQIQARLWGGTATGDLDVSNWLTGNSGNQ